MLAEPGDWGRFDEVIDVRSPEEHRADHIPGATNLPVLGDGERGRIGAMHKGSPFDARRAGASLVARNIADHLEGPLADRPADWRPLVYCWRGGQRSRSLTEVMRQVGWDAAQLRGGYKAYRGWVVGRLADLPGTVGLLVIAGRTGVGKTRVLHRLAERGEPTVDLEGLAFHRGSAFGGRGAQPTQRRFESGLCVALRDASAAAVAVVESESRKIGDIHVPGALLARMRSAPVVELVATVGDRARHIAQEYAEHAVSRDLFGESLSRIVRHAGKRRAERWHGLHEAGRVDELVREMLEQFYDIGYDKSLSRNYGSRAPVRRVRVDPSDPSSLDAAADEIAETARGLGAAARTA